VPTTTNEEPTQRPIDYDYKISQNEFQLLRFPTLQQTRFFLFAGLWVCIALVHCFHFLSNVGVLMALCRVKAVYSSSLCIMRACLHKFILLLTATSAYTNDMNSYASSSKGYGSRYDGYGRAFLYIKI
jgi:hypothetical protein